MFRRKNSWLFHPQSVSIQRSYLQLSQSQYFDKFSTQKQVFVHRVSFNVDSNLLFVSVNSQFTGYFHQNVFIIISFESLLTLYQN